MSSYEPDADDAEHISRLQALRDSGTHNMFTELKAGLRAHFGEEGIETYRWVTDHFSYFQSSEWVEINPADLRDDAE